MKQLILDAGPIIAFFNNKDSDHYESKVGFKQLLQEKTTLITPVSIVFEVYKWFLQKTNPAQAKAMLKTVRAVLTVVQLTEQDTNEAFIMVESLSGWAGSLEDATVIILARRYQCPVWTLNYRDFGIFKTLEFWNPNQ